MIHIDWLFIITCSSLMNAESPWMRNSRSTEYGYVVAVLTTYLATYLLGFVPSTAALNMDYYHVN